MIFKIKKMPGYGMYPAFFILFLILLNNCQNQNNTDDSFRGDDNRRQVSRRSDGQLREVNISSSVDFRPLSKSQFEGEDCEEFNDCENLCDEMFSTDAQRRCYNFPKDMVEALYATYENLKYVSLENLQKVDPSALAVLFDMDDRIIDYFHEDWGIQGLSALIDHTAKSALMAEVFRYKDNEKAFKKILIEFARLKHNKNHNVNTALSVNVSRYRETMLTLIKDSDNKGAMQLIFDFLSLECADSSLQCKTRVLCMRENISRRSVRQRHSDVCPYLGLRDRSNYCYIQGPDVWSYIEKLMDNRDLRDQDLANLELNEQMCNAFCSRNNNNCYL